MHDRPRIADAELTEAEMGVLARLVSLMGRIDGAGSAAESAVLGQLGARMRLVRGAPEGGPYRAHEAGPDDTAGERFASALTAAFGEELDAEACLRAAAAVKRSEAQPTIFGLLFDLAACDLIVDTEWRLLERLAELWQLDVGQRK